MELKLIFYSRLITSGKSTNFSSIIHLLTASGPWGPFGTRYRVWERCVKYMRQLKHSKHQEAEVLLKLSSSDLMLKDYDLHKDVGDEWARAMKSTSSDLIRRHTVPYFIPVDASELLDTPGVEKPSLCDKCRPVFHAVMTSSEKEEVHAARGLPPHVTMGIFGRPASLAAVRRTFHTISTLYRSRI